MDLTILHALQDFREDAGAFLNSFFAKMTFFGELSTILVIFAAVYWSLSKEFGVYLLLGYHWNRLLNGFLKVTFCAYRPWIRDATLIPDATAVKTATGYSFPSGHSMNAASIFGGLGVRRDLEKSLRIIGWLMLCLIAFSRIYLTVHTPQDILCGMVFGSLVMYCAYRLLPKILAKKNGDVLTAVISLLIAAAIAVYASIKSYPVDYDANGAILVEGSKMASDTFKAVGWNMAFFIGWILERRFVRFSSDGTLTRRVLRLICGLLGYYFVNLAICPMLKEAVGGNLGTILSCFLQMLYIVLLYPICIRLAQKKTAKA